MCSERNTIGTVPLGSGEDFDDDDDSGYYDSDGDEGSDGEEEERPVGGGERRVESDRRTVMSRMSRGTVLTPEQRVLMESQFAKTMLDYCDEELGDLEEEVEAALHCALCNVHCVCLSYIVSSRWGMGWGGASWTWLI